MFKSSKVHRLHSLQIHHIKCNGTKFQTLDECLPNNDQNEGYSTTNNCTTNRQDNGQPEKQHHNYTSSCHSILYKPQKTWPKYYFFMALFSLRSLMPSSASTTIDQSDWRKNKKNAPASVSSKEENMQFATQHNNPLAQVTSPLSFTNQQLNTITLYHITSPLAPFILDFNRMLQWSANFPFLSYTLKNLSHI